MRDTSARSSSGATRFGCSTVSAAASAGVAARTSSVIPVAPSRTARSSRSTTRSVPAGVLPTSRVSPTTTMRRSRPAGIGCLLLLGCCCQVQRSAGRRTSARGGRRSDLSGRHAGGPGRSPASVLQARPRRTSRGPAGRGRRWEALGSLSGRGAGSVGLPVPGRVPRPFAPAPLRSRARRRVRSRCRRRDATPCARSLVDGHGRARGLSPAGRAPLEPAAAPPRGRRPRTARPPPRAGRGRPRPGPRCLKDSEQSPPSPRVCCGLCSWPSSGRAVPASPLMPRPRPRRRART